MTDSGNSPVFCDLTDHPSGIIPSARLYFLTLSKQPWTGNKISKYLRLMGTTSFKLPHLPLEMKETLSTSQASPIPEVFFFNLSRPNQCVWRWPHKQPETSPLSCANASDGVSFLGDLSLRGYSSSGLCDSSHSCVYLPDYQGSHYEGRVRH